MLLATICVASAQELPLSLEEVQVEDVTIYLDDDNLLDLERGQKFEVEMHILALADIDDVEIIAFMSGYEYNDVAPISAQIGPYDFDANTTYVKKVYLTLPDDVDEDDYKLRILLSDRNGEEYVENFNLKIDVPRHLLKIKDAVLFSGHSLKAGTALIASVRVENKGERDEDDVKVTINVPELALKASDYIDEIESDEEEETEEIFLKLPNCAEPGLYLVTIDVLYNNGHDKVSGATQIEVLENPDCAPEPAPTVIVQEPPVNTTGAEAGDAEAAGAGASKVRTVLEIILIVLVALLVIVGLVIGFSRLKEA
jgi:hypothetical protein